MVDNGYLDSKIKTCNEFFKLTQRLSLYYLHNACILNIFETERIIQIKVLSLKSITGSSLKFKSLNQIKRLQIDQILADLDLTFCLVDTLVNL